LWIGFIIGTKVLIVQNIFIVNGTYSGGVAIITSHTESTIRLFGVGLNTKGARIAFAQERLQPGQRCDDEKDTDAFYLESATSNSAMIKIRLNVVETTIYYYCIKWNDSSYFFHQGTEKWLSIQVDERSAVERTTLLPIPLQVHALLVFIAILIILHQTWY